MKRRLFKMGNRLGTTYPKEILEHLPAKDGADITFERLTDGSVKISKRQPVTHSYL